MKMLTQVNCLYNRIAWSPKLRPIPDSGSVRGKRHDTGTISRSNHCGSLLGKQKKVTQRAAKQSIRTNTHFLVAMVALCAKTTGGVNNLDVGASDCRNCLDCEQAPRTNPYCLGTISAGNPSGDSSSNQPSAVKNRTHASHCIRNCFYSTFFIRLLRCSGSQTRGGEHQREFALHKWIRSSGELGQGQGSSYEHACRQQCSIISNLGQDSSSTEP